MELLAAHLRCLSWSGTSTSTSTIGLSQLVPFPVSMCCGYQLQSRCLLQHLQPAFWLVNMCKIHSMCTELTSPACWRLCIFKSLLKAKSALSRDASLRMLSPSLTGTGEVLTATRVERTRTREVVGSVKCMIELKTKLKNNCV